MVSRRTTLRLAGAGLFGLAGCTNRGADTPSPAPSPTPTPTPADGGSPTPTATPGPDVGVEVDGASPAWTRSLDGRLLADPASLDGHVAVVVDTTVYGLDAATGETAWTFESPVTPAGDYGRPTATLHVHDGTLYALVGISVGTGAHDHVLHALTADGEERWRHPSSTRGFHHLVGFGDGAAVLATSDDAIGSEGGHLAFAVNLADGRERWRAETGDGMGGSVGEDVAAVRTHGAVDVFDLATGERTFRSEPEGEDRIGATAVGGGRVFVAPRRFEGGGPGLRAFAAATGTEEWTADGAVTSLRYRDDLYAGGEHVRRFGPDGTEIWSDDGGGLLTGVPFDADALYTNAGSRVVKLARETGAERWSADATDLAIPRARGGDGLVSSDGQARTALAHEAGTGRELWRASLPEKYPPTPAADEEGAFLVTADGGVVKVPF